LASLGVTGKLCSMSEQKNVHIFLINSVWHLFIAQLMVIEKSKDDEFYLWIAERGELVHSLAENPILVRSLWSKVECFTNEDVFGGFKLVNVLGFKHISDCFYEKHLMQYKLDKFFNINCYLFNDVNRSTQFFFNHLSYSHSVVLNIVDEGFNSYLPYTLKARHSAWFITLINTIKAILIGKNSPANVFKLEEYVPDNYLMIFDDVYSQLYSTKKNIFSLKKYLNIKNISDLYLKNNAINSFDFGVNKPFLLYLTQPLYNDGLIIEKEEINLAIELKHFCKKNDLCLIIKSHPRESKEYIREYKELEEKNNCIVIDEYYLPIEILVCKNKPTICCGFFSTSLCNVPILTGAKSYSFLPSLSNKTSYRWQRKFSKTYELYKHFNGYVEMITDIEQIQI